MDSVTAQNILAKYYNHEISLSPDKVEMLNAAAQAQEPNASVEPQYGPPAPAIHPETANKLLQAHNSGLINLSPEHVSALGAAIDSSANDTVKQIKNPNSKQDEALGKEIDKRSSEISQQIKGKEKLDNLDNKIDERVNPIIAGIKDPNVVYPNPQAPTEDRVLQRLDRNGSYSNQPQNKSLFSRNQMGDINLPEQQVNSTNRYVNLPNQVSLPEQQVNSTVQQAMLQNGPAPKAYQAHEVAPGNIYTPGKYGAPGSGAPGYSLPGTYDPMALKSAQQTPNVSGLDKNLMYLDAHDTITGKQIPQANANAALAQGYSTEMPQGGGPQKIPNDVLSGASVPIRQGGIQNVSNEDMFIPGQGGAQQQPLQQMGGMPGLYRLPVPKDLVDANKRYYDKSLQAIGAQEGAVGAQTDATTKGNLDLSLQNDQDNRSIEARDKQIELSHANRMTTAQNQLDDLKKQSQALGNYHEDPDRLWNQKSTGMKILAGIGLMLAGIGHHSKEGMENITGAIDRDIAAQRAEYGAKKSSFEAQNSVYGQLMNKYKDENSADLAARAISIDDATRRLRSQALLSQNDQVRANAQMNMAALMQKKADLENAFLQRQYLLLHPGYVGTGGGKLDNAVHQYSEDLEKAKIPQAEAETAEAQKTMGQYNPETEIPGASLGLGSRLAKTATDMWSGEGSYNKNNFTPQERELMQTANQAKIAYRHAVTGVAGSEKEYSQIEDAFNSARTVGDMQSAFALGNRIIQNHKAAIRSGNKPEAVATYENRHGQYNQVIPNAPLAQPKRNDIGNQ